MSTGKSFLHTSLYQVKTLCTHSLFQCEKVVNKYLWLGTVNRKVKIEEGGGGWPSHTVDFNPSGTLEVRQPLTAPLLQIEVPCGD